MHVDGLGPVLSRALDSRVRGAPGRTVAASFRVPAVGAGPATAVEVRPFVELCLPRQNAVQYIDRQGPACPAQCACDGARGECPPDDGDSRCHRLGRRSAAQRDRLAPRSVHEPDWRTTETVVPHRHRPLSGARRRRRSLRRHPRPTHRPEHHPVKRRHGPLRLQHPRRRPVSYRRPRARSRRTHHRVEGLRQPAHRRPSTCQAPRVHRREGGWLTAGRVAFHSGEWPVAHVRAWRDGVVGLHFRVRTVREVGAWAGVLRQPSELGA